jgi:hypothetical protein
MLTLRHLLRHSSRMLLGSLAIVALTPVPVSAQGFTARGGLNVNPDQFYVGGQYDRGPLVERIWLQPNGDVGFGDDATLISLNLDVVYRRPLGKRPVWTAFGGGGPALNLYRLHGYNATEGGLNVLGGVIHRSGLITEVRVGFLESPELRVGVGYAFRPKKAAPPRTPPRPRR